MLLKAARSFFAAQPAKRLFIIAACVVALGLLFGFVITVLANVLLFDGYAADGAFQLMNPLRRLADGEAIGNNFNFFHGIGVPLIHLPLYYIFGQGLFGSEMARWIVSPGVFVLTTFTFFFVFRRSWKPALLMTVFVVAMAMIIMPFLVLPLTSLLGVRSALPVVLLVVMLCRPKLQRPLPLVPRLPITLYELCIGLLLALSLICGTEFGLAAILAFFITHFTYVSDKAHSIRVRAFGAVRIVAVFIVGLLGILTVITRGSPLQPLKFALSEIPADQFWYFGVPPNNFLHAGNLLETFSSDYKVLVMWSVALIAFCLVWRVHQLKVYRVQTQAFIFGLLAGVFSMVSMLGYYHNSEASALARMALLVGSASLALLWGTWKKPVAIKVEFGARQRRWNLERTAAARKLGWLAIAGAFIYSSVVVAMVCSEYDLRTVASTAKRFALGDTTNMLGATWHGVDEAVVPLIQANNTIDILDSNGDGFVHGISTSRPQILLARDVHESFIRPGQLIYFVKSGRQIVKAAEPKGNQLLVTLERQDLRLDPEFDGAPAKLIVAEDFNHNNNKLWSVYAGLIDAELGLHHPSRQGYDYIIHALGEQRRAEYVNEFVRVQPEFVLTLSRPYFRYEEWVQNAHWDFYSLLNQNYEVVKETQIYAVWKKRGQEWAAKPAQAQPWRSLRVDNDLQKIDLPQLSFVNVPDVGAYDEKMMKADRERLERLGKETGPLLTWLSPQDFDVYRVNEEHAKREHELVESESRGLETDALEHKAWLKEVEAASLDKRGLLKRPKTTMQNERPKRQVILVKLRYELSHPLEALPILGKTNRFFLEPNNTFAGTPISLRPYSHEVIFPLVISEKNKDSYLRLAAYSLLPGKGKLKVTDAQWTTLDASVANLKALTDKM